MFHMEHLQLVKAAVYKANGPTAVARHFGIRQQSVSGWFNSGLPLTELLEPGTPKRTVYSEGLEELTEGEYSAAILKESLKDFKSP